jgi:hypothetical protein
MISQPHAPAALPTRLGKSQSQVWTLRPLSELKPGSLASIKIRNSIHTHTAGNLLQRHGKLFTDFPSANSYWATGGGRVQGRNRNQYHYVHTSTSVCSLSRVLLNKPKNSLNQGIDHNSPYWLVPMIAAHFCSGHPPVHLVVSSMQVSPTTPLLHLASRHALYISRPSPVS